MAVGLAHISDLLEKVLHGMTVRLSHTFDFLAKLLHSRTVAVAAVKFGMT